MCKCEHVCSSISFQYLRISDVLSLLVLFPTDEDHAEPDEEEEGEGEAVEEASLLTEEEEVESMDLDQAPATVPIPAPDEPPVKRKRGRPPKNAPKAPTPSKSVRVAAKTASGKNTVVLNRMMVVTVFEEGKFIS